MRLANRIGGVSLTAMLAAAPALAADNRDAMEATVLVQQAAEVVAAMKADPNALSLAQQAKGVYVVPDFAQGAVLVGGWGGNGVMTARTAAGWSAPAFYDIAAVSAGAQIGFTEGPVVMMLMSDRAVDAFKDGSAFSLEAGAGFAIVDLSAGAGVSTDGSDVVVWSDAEGIYAGLAASASDISWDEDANDGYYGAQLSARQVLEGQVVESEPDPLSGALPQ
ncbi:MAG: lipid-binding SYLF domain-containing protein [Alphaproteobacteria bacterium]